MTTKRKAILKAIALASTATMEDLMSATGCERKNLHDNVKATVNEELIERIRDDVTGQPAYKLTPKGRQWLENDKNDDGKPQPAVGKNTGSKDTGSTVGGADLRSDPLPVGNAVTAPPKPDKKPVAAGADVKIPAPDYDPREVSFNHHSREQALQEQRAVLEAALTEAQNEAASLRQQLNEWAQHGSAYGVLTPSEMSEAIQHRNNRIADLEGNEELPLSPSHDSQLGYTVMEVTDADLTGNVMSIAEARDKAAIHALRTGQKTGVFAMIDRVEAVNVEWAA